MLTGEDAFVRLAIPQDPDTVPTAAIRHPQRDFRAGGREVAVGWSGVGDSTAGSVAADRCLKLAGIRRRLGGAASKSQQEEHRWDAVQQQSLHRSAPGRSTWQVLKEDRDIRIHHTCEYRMVVALFAWTQNAWHSSAQERVGI